MKVLSTDGLTKLIQLIKSAFISVDDTESVTEIDTETTSEITLATVATTGAYSDLSGTPTIPTVNNATLTITQGGVSKGTFTANASSDVTIALDSGGGGSSRNIGEIVASTIPLTDAGLHLLDGSLIQGGGIYDDFVQYMITLSGSHPECFTDETTWQNTVSSKGACGKFVYNSTNNTVRLPKITGFIEGTTNATALGDLVEAGLPNITGNIWAGDTYGSSIFTSSSGFIQNGSNSGWRTSTVQSTVSGASDTITFDASRSNSIYGNSNTVQPQSVKVLYYIVVATSVKTEIEVDIDEITTDLNGKADDNAVVHKTGNETIGGTKTFQGKGWITHLKNTSVTYNTAPSSSTATAIAFVDKNSQAMGVVECFRNKDNSTRMQFNIYGANGSWASDTLHLKVAADGKTTASAPTPTNSSDKSSGEIATTGWVNTKVQKVSTLPASPNSNLYYFIPE